MKTKTHPKKRLQHTPARKLQATIDDSLRQMPLKAARDLRIQIATNQIRRITSTSTFKLGPLANSLVHGFSSAASRLPSQGHKVNAFLLAHLKGLEQLSVASLFCHHACLLHRNFDNFFLQWVSDGDVKSGRRKATMVLLNCDVGRLRLRAVALVLLLNHNRREASSTCRVTKNVPDVVVAKHQGGSVEAAKRVIAEHVHLGTARSAAATTHCGA